MTNEVRDINEEKVIGSENYEHKENRLIGDLKRLKL